MNKMETKEKNTYETPEVLDINPVTICQVRGIGSDPNGYGDDE